MIICPNCREEIEEKSHFCDQCGQALQYCTSCGRVGMGRRCTYCGGLMVGADEQGASGSKTDAQQMLTSVRDNNIPTLTLYNPSLDIRMVGINGAIIGRRQGPYQQLFEGNMYISGVHAQLIYKPDTGWCIIDKNSSNGTKLNQRDLQPDVPMTIKTGDIVTLANINLQVSIS